MMRFFSTALCALILIVGLATTTSRAAGETHIYVHNETDAYVWITAYEGSYHTGGAHAWCVSPHSTDRHGVAVYIFDVRAEISTGGCQRNPILLDVTRAAVRGLKHGAYTFNYTAKGGGRSFQFDGPH